MTPDILDIQREVAQYILGAEVSLTTFEQIGSEDIIACPQVNMYVRRDGQIYHNFVCFGPDVWKSGNVTAEMIGRYFRDECGWYL